MWGLRYRSTVEIQRMKENGRNESMSRNRMVYVCTAEEKNRRQTPCPNPVGIVNKHLQPIERENRRERARTAEGQCIYWSNPTSTCRRTGPLLVLPPMPSTPARSSV